MILLFFETIVRTLITLAVASWRRVPRTRWWFFRWTWFYFRWSIFMVLIMTIAPRRGALFGALYSWFRPVDDVLDGEDPNPPANIQEYIEWKGLLIERFVAGTLRLEDVSGIDRMLVVIYRLAKSVGMLDEVLKYIPTIWKHMVDEYAWRTQKIIPTAKELDQFARSQDEAIFRLAALILGADRKVFDSIDLDRLGAFTRTDWVYDLAADLAIGLVHLPTESCREAGLTYDFMTLGNTRRTLRLCQPLRSIVRQEIQAIEVFWQRVYYQQEILCASFPSKALGLLYGRIMLKGINQNLKQIRESYQT